MMGLDPVTITTGVVTGLGILAAGIGIYKFGFRSTAPPKPKRLRPWTC